ncbi:MAG: multicopper oxidase domain-containing protein [Verrucomicrobiota bacterium]
MKTWTSIGCALMAMALMNLLSPPAATAGILPKVTNVSTSPALTNEFYLTATNITTTFNGTNVRVLVYMDDPPGGGGATRGIPAPLIELNVGQTVICHFKNNLTNNVEGASIHWHGIELDNDSDGTGVTQDTVLPGQTYTYRFIVPRPGLYWYHSHMLPGTTTYGGMYGPIIVQDTNETALIAANVLPGTNNTFPLMVSDISFTNGTVGKVVNGTNYLLNTLIQLCENSILGEPGGDNSKCSPTGKPGNLFLCNGKIPSLAGNYCTPTTNSSPVFYVGKNQRVRLQLFNASTSRTVNFSLHYPCSNPSGNTNLFHIGGQGGFLERAVLDGGVQSGYDFIFPKGTVNLGSGAREDVMFYTSGNNGDVIQLLGRSLPDPWKLDTVGILPTNYPIAFFVVTNTASTNAPITNSMPILAAIGQQVEDLSLLGTNSLTAPPDPDLGTQDGRVELQVGIAANGVMNGPNIGGYAATPLDGNSGFGAWTDVPHPPTALWARAGDVFKLAVAITSASVHPYHLHGFSMQPVAIYSENLQTNLFTFPYQEFVDTVDIYPGEALVFRVKLEDRSVLADSATGGPVITSTDAERGGNVGRWLMHCHIFLHGTVGMISELVVVPNTAYRLVSSAAGTNSVIATTASAAAWTTTVDDSWLHTVPGNTSGTGPDTVLFRYDANPGPTRVGTLHVGGRTVEVTQAGTNYVQAGPLTTLATNGLISPFGIALEDDGDVYFTDSGNNAIKRWNRTANTVSTLTSGWSTPYGIAVDSFGGVYFSQFGDTEIKKRLPIIPFVVTLFTNNATGVAGLTLDDAGNVYIAVPGQHAIKRWNVATETLTSFTTNGLISPWGVAVDKGGSVYASDIGDDSVKKLGTKLFFIGSFPFFLPYWNQITVLSNTLSNPYNLTVDDAGNIFVGDYGHGAVKKLNVASNTVTSVVSGMNSPIGVAVDKTGNLFFCDWGGNVVRELPYAFVSTTPKQEPAELTFDTLPTVLPSDENLLPPFAPIANQPWITYGGSTEGVVEFSVAANTGAARAGTLSVLGQPVTINQAGASWKIALNSLLVGPKAGSNTVTERVIPSVATWNASTATPWLHLPDTSGLGSTNILFTYDANFGTTRTGTITINGQVLTVTQAGVTYVPAPAPATTLTSTGLASPVDVAPDHLGNVFFGDSGNNTVRKWSPGTTTNSVIMSGFTPQGLDVDGAGNVYVTDFFNLEVKMWRASDSAVLTLAETPAPPSGIALDDYTNVFWAMPSPHAIYKWVAASSNVVGVVSNSLTSTRGVSLDIVGNVYIAETSANRVRKWDPLTGNLTTLISTGLSSPWDCVVDGSGNVYVADGFNNQIVQWVAASGTVITNVPGGLGDPTGVAVDAAQNIFIADFDNDSVKELPHAFIDATTKSEPFIAGTDALGAVLPTNRNLTASFAPSTATPWISITGVTNGVVSFSFTQNPATSSRVGSINVLGQSITVIQAGAPVVPVFTQFIQLTNGVFELSFTNGARSGSYSVLMTTNVVTPQTNWTLIGSATNDGFGTWKFTDISASNVARFYRIRTP